MDNFIQVPLNLPDGCVLSMQRAEQGHWLIRVQSTLEGTQCRCCGREIRDRHGLDAVVRLRHLPLFDVPVVIEIRPKRYRCPYGSDNPTTTHQCEWYEPRSPNTKAYEQWAWRMLINSTVADAARKLGVSEETFDGLLDRWIERWIDEITNYFQGRQTRGFVEGCNNRVKVLKRRCYGIFNVGRLFQRLTLDWHGYQRFGHT